MYNEALSVIDWNDGEWAMGYSSNGAATQISHVAAQTAGGRSILPLPAPAVNSSYSVQFYGPSLHCGDADESHQIAFDYYTARALYESGIITYAQGVDIFNNETGTIPETQASISFLVYSAFVPDIGWFGHGEFLPSMPTSLLWSPELPMESKAQDQAYLSTFVTFLNTLSGNVSLQQAFGDELRLKLDDSNILDTALSACPEFMLWFDTTTFTDTDSSIFGINISRNITNYVFPNEPSICRNGSLPRAIEDLANNITISMLGNADLTVQREGPVNISTSCNVYQYDNFNLIISYTAAIIVSIFSVAIGMFALYENGVSHSTSFSAIVTTTRSIGLSEPAEGSSLGAESLAKDIGDLKLRFGLSRDQEEEKDSLNRDLDTVRRAGFGMEDHVDKLRRGQACF
ncbi:hypothetical protein MMC18_004624 [Xylographa bjoerkii]|nr:hypothetical protein [Xylographa bjoerkii]